MSATARHKYLSALERVRPVAIEAMRQGTGRTNARDLLEAWRKRDPRLAADLVVIGVYAALNDALPAAAE